MIQALTRTITQDLDRWYRSSNRKPLLLRGARQTGKTWIVNAFGASHFDHVARIDFMRDVDARALFDGNLTTDTLLRSIEIYTGVPVRAESTLIFLDEIQECPRAITALKYFCEDAPDYHVVATGSYMGISRHEDASFPVGKVDMLTLHPLTFAEFLANAGQSALADLIREGDIASIPAAFSPRLADLLKTYMMVGGMPEVVLAHLNGASAHETRAQQLAILDSYDLDFSKHAPTRLLERIRLVWRSLPAQLAKENRRFVYGVVRPGARARDFEESLMWLEDYGIITRVPCVSALRAPLSSYADPAVFKLFVSDIGLLGALADLDPAVVLNGSAIFTEFKGALTEQLVCQQLVAQQYAPYYWANPQGQAEVDFALEQYGTIYPIEVKAAVNLRAKSLHVACDRFRLDHAFRMAMTDYRDEGWITNFPLWASIGLRAYLERID
ncbi:ATPase [Bifidobacterium pseudolongum subsp. globosum]|uniref:ATPase n=1 Tax=Bifidobacterium pseudolongum subsp. globosum TaxID=1690 RepID=A0A2N3QFM8_9BIFI|nr:ATP-binding protein [Bifidobacterium pseudolongum]PKU89499.1 ATPase [Bifidobacterium pseudolongum subsp. globosum]